MQISLKPQAAWAPPRACGGQNTTILRSRRSDNWDYSDMTNLSYKEGEAIIDNTRT